MVGCWKNCEKAKVDRVTKSFLGSSLRVPSVRLGNRTNLAIMLLASNTVKSYEKIRRSGLILHHRHQPLGGGLGQGADGAGREAQLHATDVLGLQIDRKRAAGVALGMTDLVTGLGPPAGKLADAAHTMDRIKNDELRIMVRYEEAQYSRV